MSLTIFIIFKTTRIIIVKHNFLLSTPIHDPQLNNFPNIYKNGTALLSFF